MSRQKAPKDPSQKKKGRGKKALRVLLIIFLILVLIAGTFMLVGFIGNKANLNHVYSLNKIVVDDPLDDPVIDEDTGYYTFTTDRTFKVLQLTDIHIGGGALSIRRDNWAIDAVYNMADMTKPDLIIVTGDMAYPVPFSSGSFNNKNPAKIFAELMEQLGIYWAPVFGNHDTEVYAYYTREQMAEFYGEYLYKDGNGKHCLFYERPEDRSVSGDGNYFINVQNSAGQITQSFIMVDSHSYAQGFFQDYDNIHQDQIDWYASEIERLNAINVSRGATSMFKSMMFFHIPLVEMKDAYHEWIENDRQDTANVKYLYGNDGEGKEVVYSGIGQDEMFETMLALDSTQAIFFGHDHYNNFSLLYNGGSGDKYIRLTYGMSIDYLAYEFQGIAKQTAQRGGTVIEVAADGSYVSYAKRLVDGQEYRSPDDFKDINNWTGEQK